MFRGGAGDYEGPTEQHRKFYPSQEAISSSSRSLCLLQASLGRGTGSNMTAVFIPRAWKSISCIRSVVTIICDASFTGILPHTLSPCGDWMLYGDGLALRSYQHM